MLGSNPKCRAFPMYTKLSTRYHGIHSPHILMAILGMMGFHISCDKSMMHHEKGKGRWICRLTIGTRDHSPNNFYLYSIIGHPTTTVTPYRSPCPLLPLMRSLPSMAINYAQGKKKPKMKVISKSCHSLIIISQETQKPDSMISVLTTRP